MSAHTTQSNASAVATPTVSDVKKQVSAFVALSRIYLETIQEATKEGGYGGVPSGHLYAMVMDKVSLDTHNRIISILVEGGLITNKNHLLKAVL